MEVNNPLYQHQGIHVITSIFTVEKGITKVLLIRRKNNPYKDMWALVGGALYNNEDLNDGVRREIFEKTGINNINLQFSDVFGRVDRSPIMRMVCISYIGLIDCTKVSFLKDTLKTSDADWFPISNIPNLAYDHNEILKSALKTLQDNIDRTDILKSLFPNGFTIPEIHKIYETILNQSIDRRNFRKKIINNPLIEVTKESIKFDGNKPAIIYKFK